MTLRHDQNGGRMDGKKHVRGNYKFVDVEGNCCWQVEDRPRLGITGAARRQYLGATLNERPKNEFNVKSITLIKCPSDAENEVD